MDRYIVGQIDIQLGILIDRYIQGGPKKSL